MADVFISHSSKDKEIADKMCETLEAKGLKCWIAPRDITPGSEWAVAISDAIATIKVMVVIYSANSAASTQVPKELGLADKRNKFIIPYKIDDMELTGAFDYYLAGAHWIVADIQADNYKMEELYGVINGVMQMPHQSITNKTYIDNVTIEASVAKEFFHKEKKSKKWLIPVGILIALILVLIVLLVSVLSKSDNKQQSENESKEIVVENTGNKESMEYREQETAIEDVEELTQDMEEASLQDLVYEISGGKATIAGYNGTAPKVVIPSEIDGAMVTYISEAAFYQCSHLKSVEIPESIEGIGAWAFAETGLRQVTIPNSVTTVGEAVFNNCTQLVSASLPSNLEKVPGYMFNGCTNLQQLDIPESVTVIGEFAFSETKFETVNLSEANIMQLGGGAFSECPNLKSVELPDTLIKIDEGAFQMCYNLETVVVPEGIKAISYNAFYDSKGVQVIKGVNTYNYETYLELASGLFENLKTDFQYEVGEDGIHITKYIGNEKVVVVPNSIDGIEVTAINKQAFANCLSMEFLSIPYGIKRIEDNAFVDCVNLRTIAGGEVVTEISYGAYRNTGISEARIPEGQQSIGYCMFYDCPYLASVYIPESVKVIEELAFSQCPGLIELRIPNSVEQIASNAFDGSENLTLVYKNQRYSYEERHKIPVMLEVAE